MKPREFELAESNHDTGLCIVKRRYDGLIYDDDIAKWLKEGSWRSFKVIELSAYEQMEAKLKIAVEALKSYKTSMDYAYEDHCDQFYLNVKDKIKEALENIEMEDSNQRTTKESK